MTLPQGNSARDRVLGSETGEPGWVELAGLMLATILVSVAGVTLFPHVVSLSTEFGRPVNEVVWTIIIFNVMATGAGGVAAALGVVVGNRRMLAVALVLLLAGSLMAALSTNLALLIVARVIQGISMAAQPLTVGIVAHHYRGDGMRRAMSMIVLAMGAGAAIAYLFSGLIAKVGGDWRTIFWVVSGAAVVNLVVILTFVRETKRTKGVPIDYVGCGGLILWSILLLVPLSQANSWGWGSSRVLGLLLPGLAVVILWALWELRCAAPLVDLRTLRRMGVWQGAVVWFAIATAMCGSAVAMPYLYQTPTVSGFGFGRDIFAVSLALVVPAAAMTLLSPSATALMRRFGAKGTMLAGMLFGLGGFGLAFAHGSVWVTLIWLAAAGVMGAWSGSAAFAVGAEAVPPEKGVVVSTIYNAASGIGASAATAFTGYLLTLRTVAVEVSTPDGTQTLSFPADATITWSALTVGAVALIGLLCVLAIRPRDLRIAGRGAETASVAAETEG